MNRFSFALLTSLAVIFPQIVNSSELPVPYNHVEYKRYGNNYSWTPLNGATPSSGGVSFPGRTTISTVEPKITTMAKLPFDLRGSVPASQMASIVTPISRVNFARALVAGVKVTTPIGAVLTAVELLDFFKSQGLLNVRNTPEGLVADGKPGGSGSQPSDGYEYMYEVPGNSSMNSGWHGSRDAACEAYTGAFYSARAGFKYEPFVNSGGACVPKAYYKDTGNRASTYDGTSTSARRTSSCPAGSTCGTEQPTTPIKEPEILEKISLPSVWSEVSAKALEKAISNGAPLQTDSPTVSGPSSIPGDKTTSKESISLNPGTNNPASPGTSNAQPGTKTTTKETKTDVKYSGNNATTTTTTNTTTTITNNVTNITTTIENKTEEKEDDKEEEDPPTDTPFKDIPELYKQKYPDGIGGVVNKKMDELKATPLFGLPALLTPSLPSTGSCPSWQIDLSLASWAGYGMHTIQAPCWVWDFGKVVIIISALLLARRLIFGG